MNHTTILVLLLILTGCATSGYKQFYTPYVDVNTLPNVENLQIGQAPKVYGTDNFDRDIAILRARRYIVIGISSFNGGYEDTENAVSQAREVGATIVLTNSEYTNTQTINSALFLPNNQTTQYSGNVYGAGTYVGYNGQSTTYGTSVVPYTTNQRRYDQTAVYLVKSNQKFKFGLFLQDLTPEQRSKFERNMGALIEVVIEDSPAFYANVMAGDVLIAIDDIAVKNTEHASLLLTSVNSTVSSTLTVIRNQQEKKILVKF